MLYTILYIASFNGKINGIHCDSLGVHGISCRVNIQKDVDTVAHGKTSESDSIFMVASPHRSLCLEDMSWGSSHSLGIKKQAQASVSRCLSSHLPLKTYIVKACSICSQKSDV